MKTLILSPLLMIAGSFLSPAALITWTNSSGGLWSVPANWSPASVPSVNDDALIAAAGSYTVTQDMNLTLNSLALGGSEGQQVLRNAGLSLAVNNHSVIHSNALLSVSGGGAVGGPGLLSVAGRLRSDNANLGGFRAGSVISVAPGGTLELAGPGNHVLWAALTNRGTIAFSGGALYVQDYTTLLNAAEGVFDIKGDLTITASYNAGVLVNAGLLRKSAGLGASLIHVPLSNNAGTLEAESGAIACDATGSTFGHGSQFLGAGTNLLVGGYLTLDGQLFSENLVLSGAVIQGTNTLTGTVRWTTGYIDSPGCVTVATNGTLLLEGPNEKGILGVLNNCGTITWTGTGRIAMGSQTVTATINNQPGALFDAANDALIQWTVYNAPVFTNAGTFRKSAGVGTTSFIGLPFFNSGTLEAQTGTISYSASGATFQAGSQFLGAGTNLLPGVPIILNGTIYSQNLEIGGAAIQGTNTLTGTVRWTSGYIDSPGCVTVATNGTLLLEGPNEKGILGVLNNCGTITWTGTGRIAMGSQTVTATINNQPGALFDAANDALIQWTVYNAPVFTNAGTFRKSAGVGSTTFLGVPLLNSGTLDAQAGTLSFSAAASSFGNGTSFVGAGTNLLPGVPIILNGTVYSQNLEIGGAAIQGTNTLTGTVRWTSGYIDSPGCVTVATNATLLLEGPNEKVVLGLLNNCGTITWTGTGRIAMGSQAVTATINNQPGALFDAANDAPIQWTAFGAPVFANAGTFRKSAGVGSTTFLGVPLLNSGTLDAQTGIISFNTAGCTFQDGSLFQGSGTNLLPGVPIILNGTIYSQNLEIGGAAIQGTNTLTGTVRWTSGYIDSPGCVTVAPNSTLLLEGANEKGIRGVLNNRGTVTWTGTGRIAMGSQTVTATIHNQPGGVFDAANDAPIQWTAFGAPAFTNTGTFRKSAGSGSTSINGMVFGNSGTVDVQVGAVAFNSGYSQSGGTMRFGLNSLANFGRVQIAGNAPITGTLAVNLNDGYVPTAGDSFPLIAYNSHTGAFSGFDLPSRAAWQTDDSIYGPNAVTLTVLNVRPGIAPIADQTVYEGVVLSFTVAGNDADPGQSINYALVNPPSHATIDPATGVFSWTPDEFQGPGTYEVHVAVVDDGVPPLGATNGFTVTVFESNLPPVLAAVPDLAAIQNVMLVYTNTATDADWPPNTVAFDLLASPTGMTLDRATGILRWTPSVAQVPGTNLVTVRVSDNGSPVGSDVQSFTVVAYPLPFLTISGAGTNVQVSWPAYAAGFALLTTTNLQSAAAWQTVTNAIVLEGGTNRILDRIDGPQRYYRLGYSAATVAPPTLSIARSGPNIVLTWPADAAGWRLQWATNLGPATVWADCTNTIGVESGWTRLTNSLGAGACYYRLRKP
jgi:hypothetical protein